MAKKRLALSVEEKTIDRLNVMCEEYSLTKSEIIEVMVYAHIYGDTFEGTLLNWIMRNKEN